MTAKLCLRPIVGYLQQLASRADGGDATDRQLLERFARERDEEAFRTLVRRHGPLVLGVGRRALGNGHDAEDCFQATFLVLARKAGTVAWHESVAGWLYQTATRLAAQMRVRAARRRRHEQVAASQAPASRGDVADTRELGAMLDDEMRRLPERCRTPLLLCYLQGNTRDQAAALLGLPLRTVERRLHDACEMLRQRLARRGVTLSAGLLAWGVAQEAVAAVPAGLVASTARDAVGFVVGTVVSRAALLAGQAVRTLIWHKVRWVAGMMLALGLVVAGMAGRDQPSPADPPDSALLDVEAESTVVVQPAAVAQNPAKLPAQIQDVAVAAAVQDGLSWIVRQQTKEGGWHMTSGQPNDVAATALALLPLLKAHEGKNLGKGPYAVSVGRGLKFLAGLQKADGGFNGGMYAQALATWALADGFRRTGDAQVKQPTQQALDYIVRAQHKGGGWRYAPGQQGDTSVTSWHVLALKHGQQAGLQVPPATFARATLYLDSVASQDGAVYGYYTPNQGSSAMTAGGLMCRQLLGAKPRAPMLLKGAAILAQTPPTPNLVNSIYYHFATRVMLGVGGPEWDAWESQLATVLLARQERAGPDRGSWSPARDQYGQAGGRLMITSLSLLALEPCGRFTLPAPGAGRKLKEGEAADCWDQLAAGNFAKVKRAMTLLAAAPAQAVPLLRERVKPVAPVDAKQVVRQIADLGSDQFEDRAAAMRELRTLGDRAAQPLRAALKGTADLETRRRIEKLLDEAERDGQTPESGRLMRAVQVLEFAGTPESLALLRSLANGAPGAQLTEAAKAAVARLAP